MTSIRLSWNAIGTISTRVPVVEVQEADTIWSSMKHIEKLFGNSNGTLLSTFNESMLEFGKVIFRVEHWITIEFYILNVPVSKQWRKSWMKWNRKNNFEAFGNNVIQSLSQQAEQLNAIDRDIKSTRRHGCEQRMLIVDVCVCVCVNRYIGLLPMQFQFYRWCGWGYFKVQYY